MMPSATYRHLPPVTSPVAFLPAHDPIGIVKQMLADLDMATPGGQRYIMGKVLVPLREAAASAESRLPVLQGRAIRGAIEELARESERLAPDVHAFAARAQTLAYKLALIVTTGIRAAEDRSMRLQDIMSTEVKTLGPSGPRDARPATRHARRS